MTFEAVSYESIPHALVSGIAISLLCSAIGLFLVLRKFSLFGDALAHSAFGGVALVFSLGSIHYGLHVELPYSAHWVLLKSVKNLTFHLMR